MDIIPWVDFVAHHRNDSLHESSMIAGMHEQLDPDKVQDQQLAFVHHSFEAPGIAFDLF